MRRPLSSFFLAAACAAGAAFAGTSPAHAQGRATAIMKRPPVDARTAIERDLGRIGSAGSGSGVIIGVDPRRGSSGGSYRSGYGSGTLGRGYDGCGTWLGGNGYYYRADVGLRGVDSGVTLGIANAQHAGQAPLFWHGDHLGTANSGRGCGTVTVGRGNDPHDVLHRRLDQEHAAWHAGHPRGRTNEDYWLREHGRLHARLDADHARWHGGHSYDWSGEHGATTPHAVGVLGARSRY